MGRIRTTWVKNFSSELAEKYPKKITTDFENNKKFLSSLGFVIDKVIRNKIAGYAAKIRKKKM